MISVNAAVYHGGMNNAWGIDWKKWGPRALALFAVALFLYLRLRNLGHTLNWDEARFVLTTRSFVDGLEGGWSNYVNFHPPLYLWVCALINKTLGGEASSFELVAIFFSLGTLFLTGCVATYLFDRWIGALSMLFLAVMPASAILDTWIKQDAAATFFITLTIFLFLKKKYAWSGIALGLGMLSKETAVFSLPAIGIFALTSWRRDRILGVVKTGLIGAVICFWWYLFFSGSVGHFGGFFLGTNQESEIWALPWDQYFRNLPYDLGWSVLLTATAGLAVCLWRLLKGARSYVLPLAWFIPTYAFLSFSVGKPYWMISSALPAVAMLASIGAVEPARWLGGFMSSERLARVAQGVLTGALVLLAIVAGVFTGNAKYNNDHGPFLLEAELRRWEADAVRENVGADEKVFLIFDESYGGSPSFFYYLGDVGLNPPAGWKESGPENAAAYILSTGANWIYYGNTHTYSDELWSFLNRLLELLPVESPRQIDDYSFIQPLNLE